MYFFVLWRMKSVTRKCKAQTGFSPSGVVEEPIPYEDGTSGVHA